MPAGRSRAVALLLAAAGSDTRSQSTDPRLPQRGAWTRAAATQGPYKSTIVQSLPGPTTRNQQPPNGFNTLPLPNPVIITFKANNI